MKFFLVFLLLISSSAAQAQSVLDYMKLYDFGGGFDFILADYGSNDEAALPDESVQGKRKGTAFGPALWFGFNFPVVPIGENASLGISPNMAINAFYDKYIWLPDGKPTSGLGINLPLMLTAKYGTDAIYTGKKKFGLTAGIGYRWTSLSVANVETKPFMLPILMGELNFVTTNKLLIKLRYLGSPVHTLTDPHNLQYSMHDFYLVFTPNW